MNIIYDDENLVGVIADFLIKAYKSNKHVMKKLSTDTLTMLVNYILERTNVHTESQAVKNTTTVLRLTSSKITKLFYINLSSFLDLYCSEAYYLRNALTEIL